MLQIHDYYILLAVQCKGTGRYETADNLFILYQNGSWPKVQ